MQSPEVYQLESVAEVEQPTLLRRFVAGLASAGTVMAGGAVVSETVEPVPATAAAAPTEHQQYCTKRDKVVLIAHRGVAERGGDGTRRISGSLYTENTVPAIIKGIKMGADGSEFDHWRSRDGYSVVYHDTQLGRPDVDPDKGGRVDSHRYEGDLDRVRLPSGARLPTYPQVIKAINENTQGASLQPELKATRGTREQKVSWLTDMVTIAQEYQATNPSADILFTSGSRELLRIVDKLSGGAIDTGLINFGGRVIPLKNIPRHIDGVNNSPTTKGLTRAYANRARQRGIEIGIRSVDTKQMFLRAFRLGARRIISDRPGVINNHC